MAAYNNYYPMGYTPSYYGAAYQPPTIPQQPTQTAPQPVQQPQIQNGGFVSVRNENEARMYPVAPGNSITFIDENAPYCYTKTMGFSQLDRPKFEKYRLVKEENTQQNVTNAPVSDFADPQANSIKYATKTDMEAVIGEIGALRKDLDAVKRELSKGASETSQTKKATAKAKKEEKEAEE